MKKALFLAATILALGACSGESGFPDPTGKGSIRAINAIKTSPDFEILIEERSLGTVSYKSSTSRAEYDDFSYRFNFEVGLPGDTVASRVASRELQVVADTEYTFVLSGQTASPTITIWETPERDFAGTETVFEARFAHTADSLGDVDIYFAAPGTAPVLGEQRATAGFGQVSPPEDLEAGEYVLTVTAAGDPTTVYFQSDTIEPIGATALLFAVFDGDGNDLTPYAARVYGSDGSSVTVAAEGVLPRIRFFHAASNLATSDIYVDEDVTDLRVQNHAFRDIAVDIEVPAELLDLTYTAAGNVGAILFEQAFSPQPNTRSDFWVVNDGEELAAVFNLPDLRSVETQAKFSFITTASDQETIDLYVVEADSDITEQNPVFFNVTPTATRLSAGLNAGSLDIYMTVAGEKTVVAGPLRIDPELGDIIEVVAYDTVDPTAAEMVVIPSP